LRVRLTWPRVFFCAGIALNFWIGAWYRASRLEDFAFKDVYLTYFALAGAIVALFGVVLPIISTASRKSSPKIAEGFLRHFVIHPMTSPRSNRQSAKLDTGMTRARVSYCLIFALVWAASSFTLRASSANAALVDLFFGLAGLSFVFGVFLPLSFTAGINWLRPDMNTYELEDDRFARFAYLNK